MKLKEHIGLYVKRPSSLLFHAPLVVAYPIWFWTGHWYWGALEWAVMTPIIASCIARYDFGTWRFWRRYESPYE